MLVNQLGKPMSTLYSPSTVPKTDVTFREIKHPTGNVNYVAFIGSVEDDIIEDTEDEDAYTDDESSELYEKKEIYNPLATSASPTIFSLGDDPIKTFYIGSVTVVGLFILYRMLIKK